VNTPSFNHPTGSAEPTARTERGDRRTHQDPERKRLRQIQTDHGSWKLWGPYLSDRQWGTVREDYSPDGAAWDYFPHDHARSRAYRWGEDGLLGICDEEERLCFALTVWNGVDPILKERLFGLAGPEGNHGEDVKECYYFLDNIPTHSYMRALYKYPQRAFPYAQLVHENQRRGRQEPEYELRDTDVFDEHRYFDVFIEYAKASPDDICIHITVSNRGPDAANLDLLPTLWFRNDWAWDRGGVKPDIRSEAGVHDDLRRIATNHARLGEYWLHMEGTPKLLFTENESNVQRLWGAPNTQPYVKDGFHRAIIDHQADAVCPDGHGTKAAAQYTLSVAPGGCESVHLRLSRTRMERPFDHIDEVFTTRRMEADAFYAGLGDEHLSEDAKLIQRQAFAGLLWSKQFYHFNVNDWLEGDPAMPPPPPQRKHGRDSGWRHFNSHDILAMPDTWEYPWFAAWDLAFHCIPLALIDPAFAKHQLEVMGHEWYQHPNGEFPAYEWAFSDVNPPVHAWAAWRVYKIEQRVTGHRDRAFLERVFHKLLLNFTWWVNRKDPDGRNVFEGGFLGLDNIGVFDRSTALPTGGHIEQSDGTAWMGMFCLNMLTIAAELALENHVYEDLATKFFEHFLYIADALNNIGGEGVSLWDEEDEFFYDVLHLPNDDVFPLKVRSLVGLIPLFAVETLDPQLLDQLPGFKARLEWFLEHKPDLARLVSRWQEPGSGERRLVALVRGHRMKCLLRRMLDPNEFLSDHGVRALSKYHLRHPYEFAIDGTTATVDYEPGESTSGVFGGNSNWRGPVWFPANFLLIESLQKFHHYFGDDFRVECPTGSGTFLSLWQVAEELSRRLQGLFKRDVQGRRAVYGDDAVLQSDPHWRDLILFYEYFHGDTGVGLGASHQTGWTALIAKILDQTGDRVDTDG